VSFQSRVFGVTQPASVKDSTPFVVVVSLLGRARTSTLGVFSTASSANKVAPTVSFALVFSTPAFAVRCKDDGLSPLDSSPVDSLADVWCPDARSTQIGSRSGISHVFQVRQYSREPSTASLARNLLAKDDWRAALADEIGESWPEVSFVGCSELISGTAERLARAAPSPDLAAWFPASKIKGEGPSADSGEEVTLSVLLEFIGFYFGYAALVHDARRY
jgi:hypothetical protein